MIAVLAPGQGAQTPGMLGPWMADEDSASLIAACAERSGLDLVHLGTRADAETIRDTAVAQPLIVTASLVSFRALQRRVPGLAVSVAAGHSVGELAALAVARVLTDAEAVSLVAVRGRAMAEAAAATPTGMSAVVGGDPEEVREAIEAGGLTAANVNGGGQVVAAGTLDRLGAFAANPPARARVVALSVAGAFHTDHMAPARQVVADAAGALSPVDPRLTLLSNRDGRPVTDGVDALGRIAEQVTRPVRWDLCCETMLGLGVTRAVELSPGGVLTKLARRTLPGVAALALTGPDDLDAAAALLADPGDNS